MARGPWVSSWIRALSQRDLPGTAVAGTVVVPGLVAEPGREDRTDHRTGGGPGTTRIPSPRTR